MSEQSNTPPARDEGQNARLLEFFQTQADTGLLFTQAMSQTRMAMCISDPNREDCPIVFANAAFCELTGYSQDEIIGRNCRFLQGEETSQASVERMREIVSTEQVGVVEILNYKKDGTRFWNSVHIGPIYDSDDQLKFFFGSQWDVTDVAAARVADQQFATVMRELNHRIMNVFAVISSIITISERAVETKQELAKLSRDRVQALGTAHRASIHQATAGSQKRLADVIEEILTPFGLSGTEYRMSGPPLNVSPELMLSLTMILYELATNSSKYGSFGGKADPVEIKWELQKGAGSDGSRNMLDMSWTEPNPATPPTADTQTKGSGSGEKIMQAMAVSAEGNFEVSKHPEFVARFQVALTQASAEEAKVRGRLVGG
ncbi:MAG: PAS domain-containing protein [Pseudomonadota bacterium]